MAKDYFSHHAKTYAAFRPTYPEKLYQFIFSHLRERSNAWDCGTGNGQVASDLSKYFKRVDASDISQQQIDHAFRADNIHYTVCPAEKTPFDDNTFDLITVAQALHWMNTDQFYEEVRRTGKPGSLLAVWGYARMNIQKEIEEKFLDFYSNTVGAYWDPARKLVENEYRDIPFPFEKIPSPAFSIETSWTLEQFVGYVRSWSATQKYIRDGNEDPVPAFADSLRSLWNPGEKKQVVFPIFLQLGHVR